MYNLIDNLWHLKIDMQHYPFFKEIGKKIEELDKYIPKQNNS